MQIVVHKLHFGGNRVKNTNSNINFCKSLWGIQRGRGGLKENLNRLNKVKHVELWLVTQLLKSFLLLQIPYLSYFFHMIDWSQIILPQA